MQINTTVYPEIGHNTYCKWSNQTIDYSASEPLEHSIFYSGSISENVQFCDETNYTYNAQAPNCSFSVAPREIVKGDIFFIKDGYRHFNFNGSWVYNNTYNYNIVTEFDVSQFYFDLDKLTVHVYDTSQPDGGHAIGSVISMPFTEYRNKSAEYKRTHLIRDCLHNWGISRGDSFLKYKNVENYADVNVVPMIRYVFSDKTTLYLPFGMLTNYANLAWQGPYNLDNFTGFGKFSPQLTDIYLAQYPGIGKWSNDWSVGGPAQAVTMANCGRVDNLVIHAGTAGQQVQQIINGYQMPDLTSIDTNKYCVPVFLWGNRWDKRIEAFYTDEYIMRYFASSGLRFKVDNIMYIGYMNANGQCNGDYILESELADSDSANKNITDFTGSAYDANVPFVPPSPSERIEDKELDMSTLMLSGSAGMVHYYEINKTGTATANQISDAISKFDITTIGKDLMRNLISYKAFAVLPTSSVFNNIIHVAGKDLKDENDNYLMGDVILGMSKLSLGTITIPTLYNDYRDYEPYTRIEMFVPFCGWFHLPSWCMGKTITGEMFVDLYNGTCKAIIKASNTVVAETGGNVAYDIPFVAESTGAKAGAVISSALTTAVSTAGFAATPNIATGAAALSSAANLASAVNSNQTTLKGVLGDGSNVNGLNRCFIKVTRPQSPNGSTNIPDSYKHEIGIPTMKEITLSAGDGYIQVMDAKVTGTMTAREKQMIVDGFRHGLNF